jgi:GTPase SAR1 family protein
MIYIWWSILVGNKCDMKEDQTVPSHSGEEFAREHGLTFYEASAKENINVHEVTLSHML